jgi:hypothetical protein
MIPTTMWVRGDVIHNRHQTTRKSLVLLAKQIGVSASSTRIATKLLNLHPLWFTNSAIQTTKYDNSLNWLPSLGVYITYTFCLVAKLGFISADA